MNRVNKLGLVAAMTASLIAVPTIAVAQAQGPSYCNLVTPTVRDVVQEAPAIAAVLNLDPALPDSEIVAQRERLGCGEVPAQTPDEARGELCAVLNEARVEELVLELNNPNAVRGLETVRPALGLILAQARDQLNCDAGTETPGTETPGADETPGTDTPGADETEDDTDVVVIPEGSADTGDGSYTA